MNEQQQIKSLTWKYFWKQKKEEISYYFVELSVCSFLMAVMFIVIGIASNEEYGKGLILTWVGISVISLWILVGIVAILNRFKNWLKSNWKQAQKRARDDIQNGHKKKKNRR